MDAEVAQRLIALNKAFYQKLASPFSATRGQVQPGVKRVLDDVPADAAILDLGCGNGSVARELVSKKYQGKYVGVDFSKEMLEEARKNVPRPTSHVEFVQADLTATNWNLKSPIAGCIFDFIFAFAVLHHIPSREIRMSFLNQVGSLMEPRGRFVLSNWQFLNSPRLREKIQTWEKLGLSDSQVDKGDYLLDWRSGELGLRYVHHFEKAELAGLAVETGFRVVDEFLSDGKSGNLALYQEWEKL